MTDCKNTIKLNALLAQTKNSDIQLSNEENHYYDMQLPVDNCHVATQSDHYHDSQLPTDNCHISTQLSDDDKDCNCGCNDFLL